MQVSWGRKVSDVFVARVAWIVDMLDIGTSTEDGINKLMTCMAWESGRTFAADIKNMAGSGATGLIQFMPKTAKQLGTTVGALAEMTPEKQLNYVYKYFRPYSGRLKELSDLYMAILWPAAVGKPENYVLWEKGKAPTTYRQNSGLDMDKDGSITKGEAAAKVSVLLAEGLGPRNVREVPLQGTQTPVPPAPVPAMVPKEPVPSVRVEAGVFDMSFFKKLGKGLLHGLTTKSTLGGIGAIVVGSIADPAVAHVVQSGVNAVVSGDPVAIASVAIGLGGVIFNGHKADQAEKDAKKPVNWPL